MGIEEVVTAARSPWQNPYAERLITDISGRHKSDWLKCRLIVVRNNPLEDIILALRQQLAVLKRGSTSLDGVFRD
jgi:hypothetical protein